MNDRKQILLRFNDGTEKRADVGPDTKCLRVPTGKMVDVLFKRAADCSFGSIRFHPTGERDDGLEIWRPQ